MNLRATAGTKLKMTFQHCDETLLAYIGHFRSVKKQEELNSSAVAREVSFATK
jgi:hypothetical protein